MTDLIRKHEDCDYRWCSLVSYFPFLACLQEEDHLVCTSWVYQDPKIQILDRVKKEFPDSYIIYK